MDCKGSVQWSIIDNGQAVRMPLETSIKQLTEVKEADLPFVPKFSRVRGGTTLAVGLVHFHKQAFVPLAIYMPVLHRVTDIACLNQMFKHNADLEFVSLNFCRFTECVIPTSIPVGLEFLVNNICCQSYVYDCCMKLFEIRGRRRNTVTESGEVRLQEEFARNVDGVLLGNALVFILCCKVWFLFRQLNVRDSQMVDVVNECAEYNGLCDPGAKICESLFSSHKIQQQNISTY